MKRTSSRWLLLRNAVAVRDSVVPPEIRAVTAACCVAMVCRVTSPSSVAWSRSGATLSISSRLAASLRRSDRTSGISGVNRAR